MRYQVLFYSEVDADDEIEATDLAQAQVWHTDYDGSLILPIGQPLPADLITVMKGDVAVAFGSHEPLCDGTCRANPFADCPTTKGGNP